MRPHRAGVSPVRPLEGPSTASTDLRQAVPSPGEPLAALRRARPDRTDGIRPYGGFPGGVRMIRTPGGVRGPGRECRSGEYLGRRGVRTRRGATPEGYGRGRGTHGGDARRPGTRLRWHSVQLSRALTAGRIRARRRNEKAPVRRGEPGGPGTCPWPRHQPCAGRSPARGTPAPNEQPGIRGRWVEMREVRSRPLGSTACPPPRAPAPRRGTRRRTARPPAPPLAARAAPPPRVSHAVRQRAGRLAGSRGKTLPGGDTTTNVMDQRGAGRGGADFCTALPRSRKSAVTDAPSCPLCRPKPPS